VTKKSKNLVKSQRNELEIVSVLNQYLSEDSLNLTTLNTSTAWMDCGTVQSLNLASEYIKKVSIESNMKIGCIEEIAYRQGWITTSQVVEIAKSLGSNEYAAYLKNIVDMKLLNSVNEGEI
jgi:glucose-1-phosphate thymidylyltransferase